MPPCLPNTHRCTPSMPPYVHTHRCTPSMPPYVHPPLYTQHASLCTPWGIKAPESLSFLVIPVKRLPKASPSWLFRVKRLPRASIPRYSWVIRLPRASLASLCVYASLASLCVYASLCGFVGRDQYQSGPLHGLPEEPYPFHCWSTLRHPHFWA